MSYWSEPYRTYSSHPEWSRFGLQLIIIINRYTSPRSNEIIDNSLKYCVGSRYLYIHDWFEDGGVGLGE